jgi:putative membrane protein
VKGFIIGVVATAIAFAILVYLLPDDRVAFGGDAVALVGLSIVFGVVNGLIKPIVRLLALPIRVMTLGLIGFVINAAMLLLTAWFAYDVLNIEFTVGGFPAEGLSLDAIFTAIVASIVLSIISTIVGLVIHD